MPGSLLLKGRPSLTACWVAAARAHLVRSVSTSGDGEAGLRLARDLGVRMPVHLNRTFMGYLRGRTQFFDAIVQSAAERAGAVGLGGASIVVIGAGYDDRSLRFRSPGARFVEVDHPVTQHDKLARLERLGVDVSDVTFVAADLERDPLDVVLAGVVDTALPVTFVCEGVLPYLSRGGVEQVLRGLSAPAGSASASASASVVLAADLPLRPRNLTGRWAVAFMRVSTGLVGEPVRTIIDTEGSLATLLARCGWREQRRVTGGDLGMPSVVRDVLLLELVPAAP